jgi:hypothetical protein
MDNASVAVLLISPDSLTSAFILREEVTHLLERRDKDGLYIVPIVVRPCAWKQVKWLTQMQIRITPDRDNRKKKKQLLFSVDVFFWKREMDIEYWPTDADDKPRSLENVPQLLEYLLARHTDAPQVIEFFLPRELISGDVNQWDMTQSVLLQTKFGIEYQIVVRSLDRLALLGNQFRDHWKMRWHQFQRYLKRLERNTSWSATEANISHKSFTGPLALS